MQARENDGKECLAVTTSFDTVEECQNFENVLRLDQFASTTPKRDLITTQSWPSCDADVAEVEHSSKA